jgi:hypothetical protein
VRHKKKLKTDRTDDRRGHRLDIEIADPDWEVTQTQIDSNWKNPVEGQAKGTAERVK